VLARDAWHDLGDQRGGRLELYIAFKAAGTLYIAYLAYNALRPGGSELFEPRTLARDSNWRLYRMGLITNLLNPKAAILYLALIPEFIHPAAGHVIAQGFALGTIQMSVSLTVNALLILAAGSRSQRSSPRVRNGLSGSGGSPERCSGRSWSYSRARFRHVRASNQPVSALDDVDGQPAERGLLVAVAHVPARGVHRADHGIE
jgi:hypothetical protein